VRVLDLYAGVGGRALTWAAKGAEVSAGEVDGEAVESGRGAARGAGLSVDLREGRVEELLPRMLPAEAIVINPPRRGLSASVSDTLVECGARLLVYVSCDPATLARDIARLGSGWTIDSVQPFDAFPHTYHVETVVLLRATGGNAGRDAGGPA
jgi:23S rRNA (uracil1939-C5)-methyltransferase